MHTVENLEWGWAGEGEAQILAKIPGGFMCLDQNLKEDKPFCVLCIFIKKLF
jgi:hypothetical protein